MGLLADQSCAGDGKGGEGVLGAGLPQPLALARMSAAALSRGEPGFRDGGEEIEKSQESKIVRG